MDNYSVRNILGYWYEIIGISSFNCKKIKDTYKISNRNKYLRTTPNSMSHDDIRSVIFKWNLFVNNEKTDVDTIKDQETDIWYDKAEILTDETISRLNDNNNTLEDIVGDLIKSGFADSVSLI